MILIPGIQQMVRVDPQLAVIQVENYLAATSQLAQAMQLRYLQTLTAIAGEKSSTIIFSMPIDLIAVVLDRLTCETKSVDRDGFR